MRIIEQSVNYLVTLRSGLNFWITLEGVEGQWRGLYATTALGGHHQCETQLFGDQDAALKAAIDLLMPSTGMRHVTSAVRDS